MESVAFKGAKCESNWFLVRGRYRPTYGVAAKPIGILADAHRLIESIEETAECPEDAFETSRAHHRKARRKTLRRFRLYDQCVLAEMLTKCALLLVGGSLESILLPKPSRLFHMRFRRHC
jgi:hypothetical protein